MTRERVVCIATPLDGERRQLLSDVRSAAGRAGQADPGDRLDIVRYEAFLSQLELWAFSRRQNSGCLVFDLTSEDLPDPAFADSVPLPPWVPPANLADAESIVREGGVLVAIQLPSEVGSRTTATPKKMAPPAAKPWKAGRDKIRRKDGTTIEVDVVGSRAVEKRFKEQLEAAITAKVPEPIYPTGIQHRILSDVLRSYVHKPEEGPRVDVPVEYRDGSRAQHPFPLRALKLIPILEEPHDISLRMALLSIRHTEMDAIVDGSWLRNAQISRPRPQAETDDLVYGISLEQLAALTGKGDVRLKLEIFQTGLEPANVGFYRAVAMHLLTYPGSLSVVPQYHQQPRPQRPQQGQGSRRSGRGGHQGARSARPPMTGTNSSATTAQSQFLAGKVWTTRRGGSS